MSDLMGQYVFVAMWHVEYEDSGVIDICSTLDKAKESCLEYERQLSNTNTILNWITNERGDYNSSGEISNYTVERYEII